MRVATDIGGTFTDLVYVNENSEIMLGKANTTPSDFEKGVIDVIKKENISFESIKTFIHGTTVVVNALTERKGVKTGLITTKGFRDVLEIARGNRPDLFNVLYKKPKPFVERYLRFEADERMNYKGDVLTSLNMEDIKNAVVALKKEKVEAIAIVFLHSYANTAHEMQAAKYVKELWPEVFVTCSYEITKEWREYERTTTTVLNAYVQPIASTYINNLESKIIENGAKSVNYLMQSNGGTTTFEHGKITPINILESGPVAGVYGAAVLGKLIGETNIIALDVGGTTAKCSLVENGEIKISTDFYIEKDSKNAGYPIKIPVIDILEIGNGGGSIAWIDEAGSLKVGPISAGAVPGPVAYNKGGTLPTTTDANLITGRLSSKNFDFDVDIEMVKEVLTKKIANAFDVTVEEAALGIIRIANANMLNALKLISVRKGHDPSEFSLIAYGGGGSMHALSLAKDLGVKKVIIPVASPVFSAWGMIMTDVRHDYTITYIKKTNELNYDLFDGLWNDMESRAKFEFESENINLENVHIKRFVNMRYTGQEHSVSVPCPLGKYNNEILDNIISNFHKLHEKQYTFSLEGITTEIVSLHVAAVGEVLKPEIKKIEKLGKIEDSIKETRPVYFENTGWVNVQVYDRNLLPTNVKITGPLLVEEKAAVTVVYDGQILHCDCYGNLIIDLEVKL